jgi:hypothetical protein
MSTATTGTERRKERPSFVTESPAQKPQTKQKPEASVKPLALHKIGTPAPHYPEEPEIRDLLGDNGWIPLATLTKKERLHKTGGLNISPREIPYIHPRDICILRMKHEMARNLVSGNPGDTIVLVYSAAIDKIDQLLPGIIEPNKGWGARYVAAYGHDPEFCSVGEKYATGMKHIQEHLEGQPFPALIVWGVPYWNPDTSWFMKRELRDTLSTAAKIAREDIVFIQFYPPVFPSGVHNGRALIHLRDQTTADILLALNQKINVPSKNGKLWNLKIEIPRKRPPAQTAAPKPVKEPEEF